MDLNIANTTTLNENAISSNNGSAPGNRPALKELTTNEKLSQLSLKSPTGTKFIPISSRSSMAGGGALLPLTPAATVTAADDNAAGTAIAMLAVAGNLKPSPGDEKTPPAKLSGIPTFDESQIPELHVAGDKLKAAEQRHNPLVPSGSDFDLAITSDSEIYDDCHSDLDSNMGPLSFRAERECSNLETFRSALDTNDEDNPNTPLEENLPNQVGKVQQGIEEVQGEEVSPAHSSWQNNVANTSYHDEPMDVDESFSLENQPAGVLDKSLGQLEEVQLKDIVDSGISNASENELEPKPALAQESAIAKCIEDENRAASPQAGQTPTEREECEQPVASPGDNVSFNVCANAPDVLSLSTKSLPSCGNEATRPNVELNNSHNDSSLAAPTSPIFPIKQSAKDFKSFPQSPNAHGKEDIFLEKSDYVDKELRDVVGDRPATPQIVITDRSSEERASVPEEAAPLNNTFDAEPANRFDGGNLSSKDSGTERRRTFTVDASDLNATDVTKTIALKIAIENENQAAKDTTVAVELQGAEDRTYFQSKTIPEQEQLNSTFDAPSIVDTIKLAQDAANESDKDKRRTFDVNKPSLSTSEDKRRTFAITKEVELNDDVTEQAQDTGAHSDNDKRRTFNVKEPPIITSEENNRTLAITKEAELNESFEPMDVDEASSFRLDEAVTTAPKSPSVTTPRKNEDQVGETSLQGPPAMQQPFSPPIPTLQKNRGNKDWPGMPTEFPPGQESPKPPATEAMQQQKFSPPIPTLQKSRTTDNCRAISSANLSASSLAMKETVVACLQSTPSEGAIQQQQPFSPPIPTLQKNRANNDNKNLAVMPSEFPSDARSPPTPLMQKNAKQMCPRSPPALSTLTRTKLDNNEDFKDPLPEVEPSLCSSPPVPTVSKRPPIHAPAGGTVFTKPKSPGNSSSLRLTAMEQQSKQGLANENDECGQTSPLSCGSFNFGFTDGSGEEFSDADFQCVNNNLILNPSDFDYLLTKGSNNVQVDRNSLLLRFDPLLGVPVQVNHTQKQQQQLQHILAATGTGGATNKSLIGGGPLSTTLEEDDSETKCEELNRRKSASKIGDVQRSQLQTTNAKMSVDVINDMNIDNDCKKSYENSQTDEKQINYKMDELEKKIKNEVLKTEDIEKKLKEAEQREEALIKRITEKDKTITKMNGVIEAYEKAIAELIAEKEQMVQSYERQLAEVKSDRDSNYQHLTSLETTFSDLHIKYEKSKEMTAQLKASEESLLAEKRQTLDNLRLQEQRYEKMKNHAIQQLEIANKKIESQSKEHAMEITKLKALLKKEEISRASMSEQLEQKTRENAELVKICDELISGGQGS